MARHAQVGDGGEPSHWLELRHHSSFRSTLDVLIAAEAATVSLRVRAIDPWASPRGGGLDLADRIGLHRVADALCRIATRAMGRASDAYILAARLAPFAFSTIERFVQEDVAGQYHDPLARSLAAPLSPRRPLADEVTRVVRDQVEVRRDSSQRTGASAIYVRALRSVARRRPAELPWVRQVLADVALGHTSDDSLDRRAALWFLLEFASTDGGEQAARVLDTLMAGEARGLVADISATVESVSGGGGTEGLAAFAHTVMAASGRDPGGGLPDLVDAPLPEWRATGPVEELLNMYLPRGGGRPTGRRWRNEALSPMVARAACELLREAIVTPSSAHVTYLHDTFFYSHPAVRAAAAESVARALRTAVDARLDIETPHIVDRLVNLCGTLRSPVGETVEMLGSVVRDGDLSTSIRASGCRALGDLAYQVRAHRDFGQGDTPIRDAVALLRKTAQHPETLAYEPVVARAALHSLAVLRDLAMAPVFARVEDLLGRLRVDHPERRAELDRTQLWVEWAAELLTDDLGVRASGRW